MAVVLAIPDTQIPFMHRDASLFLKAVKHEYNPTVVVQIGDLLDCHAFSRWGTSTRALSGKEEVSHAVKQLQESLYKLFPKVYVCWGNHDLRIQNKAEEVGIDGSFLRSFEDIIEAPKGWKFADSWDFDGVKYEHGIGRSGPMGAITAAKSNMQSTVIGHLHSNAGILWYGNKKTLIFGFNIGALIDDKKYAFEYARFSSSKSILGVGLIINGTPIYIPMILNSQGRWIGKLGL